MKKDVHGLLNTLIGIVLALSSGIYFSELPAILFWLLLIASAFLILREVWVLGGRLKWALELNMPKQ